MMVPMREGTGMAHAQYKVYLWLLVHARQAGKDSYLTVDEPDDFRGRGIAKACGVASSSVKDILAVLRGRRLVVNVGTRGFAGGAVHLPEIEGARYAEVDPSDLRRCFAYGAPSCAAEAYVTLVEQCRGDVPGMTGEKGEEAVEWLKANGMAQESSVDGERLVCSTRAGGK